MAARRASKKRSEKPPEPPVTGSLSAEIVRALERLTLFEGSVAAVVRVLRAISPSLRLTAPRLRRWLAVGSIPARDLRGDEEAALLFAIFARLTVLDRDTHARGARERKIAEYRAAREILEAFESPKKRRAFVETLRGWVRRHGEVARLRGFRESGLVRFATELGVRPELLRRALAPGEEAPGVKLVLAFRAFEARERDQAIEDEKGRRALEELMELARETVVVMRPEKRRRRVHEAGRVVWKTVTVQVPHEEVVTPKAEHGSAEFSGSGTYGWRWSRSIRQFLPRLDPSGKDAWAVVEKFARFALQQPGLEPARRYPEWNVTAFASRLGESETGSSREHRALGGHPLAARFVVSEVYSGKNRRGFRARERTVAGFIQHIGEGIDTGEPMFLHWGYVWNFRRRSEEEKKRVAQARRESWEMSQLALRVKQQEIVKRKKKARRKQVRQAVLRRRAERRKKQ